MRWLLSSCLLGGLSALLKHFNWPYADWVNGAGFGLLVLGFLRWLNDTRYYWPSQSPRGDGDVDLAWIPVDTGIDSGAGDGGCDAN